MNKTRIMIVLLFVLAFASGLAVAMVIGYQHHHAPMPSPSWLTSELKLTQQQQDEMIKIWGSLGRPNGQDEGDRRRAMSKQRDEAIRALIPIEKQKDFDAILENHNKQIAEIYDQRRKAFETAVEKTKAILTPEQRTKYEEILAKRMDGRHGPGGPGFPGGPDMRHGWQRNSTQPTSRPATTAPEQSESVTTTTRPENSDSR